jgi:integrase
VTTATKRKRHRHLRVFFRWCVSEKHIRDSPLERVKKPKAERKAAAFLTENHLRRLLDTIDRHVSDSKEWAGPRADLQWLRDIIQVTVCTGLRRGEVRNLRWRDIDLEGLKLTVRNREGFKSKSGNERRIPIRGDAVGVLKRLDAERKSGAEHGGEDLDAHVFRDEDGHPINPSRISHRFKDMVRKAQLSDAERLHFHSLRHTTASWLAMHGVSLRVIQAILGHSSQSVTEGYAHLQSDVLGSALESAFGKETRDEA